MANQSVLELAVSTGKWDSGLKKAKDALNNFTQAQGGLQSALKSDSDKMQQFVQMMGSVDSRAKTAKGQLNDYKSTIETLTMQYNRMNEAQKASIGQDYLKSIDQLKQKYQAVNKEIQEMNLQLKETPSPAVGAIGGGGLFGGDKLSGMLQVFGGNVMTKIAGAGLSFASEMGDMIKQGIELARQTEGVRMAFERLNNASLLDNLRQATHGTVTDLELMKAAVQFNNFNLPLEELGTMLAFAQQKAKDTGQSVDYMVQSIVTGLGRKSVMILDNLGLSAAEIRERMKESGDMTKAVGEIIREQMAKAGDYVETAADRATQANVELTNAMTRLGETFQPISDMGTSMWTSLKTGALDLLNNVLEPLINKFTQLGRMRAVYEGQSGNERVNRQLNFLRSIGTDSYRRGTYKAQLANYDSSIKSHQQYIDDYHAWQRDKTNVGAYDRMQAFQKQTGLEWVSDVQSHLDAFKKMRAEYVNGAKAILQGNPAPATNNNPLPVVVTNTPTGGGGVVDVFDANKTIFNTDTALMSGYKTPDGGGPSDAYQAFLESERNNTDSLKSLTEALERLNESEGISKKGTGERKGEKNRRQNPYLHEGEDGKQTAKLNEVLGGLGGGLSTIAGGLEQMGIEIPEGINRAIGVVQGISAILTGIATTLLAIEAIEGADAIIPFAKGGIVKAFSGTLVGNTYSGDQLRGIDQSGQLYGLNAGEVVLNRAQVGNLASQLSGGMAAMQLSAVITGEQLRLVLNNNGRRTGRGEYVTTNFR